MDRPIKAEGDVDIPFSISEENAGGVAVVRVAGELDESTCDGLTGTVENAFHPCVTEIVVDMDRETFMDSHGIRALLLGREAALRRGCGYR